MFASRDVPEGIFELGSSGGDMLLSFPHILVGLSCTVAPTALFSR